MQIAEGIQAVARKIIQCFIDVNSKLSVKSLAHVVRRQFCFAAMKTKLLIDKMITKCVALLTD